MYRSLINVLGVLRSEVSANVRLNPVLRTLKKSEHFNATILANNSSTLTLIPCPLKGFSERSHHLK